MVASILAYLHLDGSRCLGMAVLHGLTIVYTDHHSTLAQLFVYFESKLRFEDYNTIYMKNHISQLRMTVQMFDRGYKVEHNTSIGNLK